jgi:multiple sugar transport system ATP-binding protein
MEMRAQLKALQQQLGVTTIYVTHDQMEAMTLGDRVAVLKGGVIQQMGSPADIYDHPANTFVARFIGSPPMNLFTGACDSDRGVFVSGPFELRLPESVLDGVRGRDAVTVGVRPEHISLGSEGDGVCDVSVDVIENVGGEYLVYVFSDTGQVVARVPEPPRGPRASLVFAPDSIHVFEE